jgi:hypothetical protein
VSNSKATTTRQRRGGDKDAKAIDHGAAGGRGKEAIDKNKSKRITN